MQSGMNYFEYKTQFQVSGAAIRLTRINVHSPVDASFHQNEGYWLDCSLTPRLANARGCFAGRQGSRHDTPFGNVFMMPPGQTLLARTDNGEQMSLLCVLEKEQVERWLERDFRWQHRHLEASMDIQASAVVQLLRRLGEEICRPCAANEILCEAIVIQLAVELARYYDAVTERPEAGGLAGWRLRMIEDRIRGVAQPPTLAELACMCGLSVRQLTRGFRTVKGRSLGDFIAEVRIDRAKRMLCKGEQVKAVAFTLGFASSSGFCQAFRQATGHSPREFRLFASA